MEYGYVKCMDKPYQRKDSIWTLARKGKGSIKSCPGFWASFRSSISPFLTFRSFFSSHGEWQLNVIRRLAKTCCWYFSWVEQHHTEFMFNLHITQSNQHHEHIFLEQTEMIDNFYFTPLVGATSANQHHKNIFLEQTDMINNFYFTPLVGATWADQHHTEFMFNPPHRVSGQRITLLFSDRRQLHLSKCAVSKYWCFFAYLWMVESPLFI